jgi:hypothetical protein
MRDWQAMQRTISDQLRRTATVDEVEAALRALDSEPVRIRVRDWPSGLVRLDAPGLYSWWADDHGLRELELGLGLPIAGPRIYGGEPAPSSG